MLTTPITLYRQGNATSPRMDHVRANKDIAIFEDSGVTWVLANLSDGRSPGGISTFTNPGIGKNWWKLDVGCALPIELKLLNDHGNHWLWQPSQIMTIDSYQSALKMVGALFIKID